MRVLQCWGRGLVWRLKLFYISCLVFTTSSLLVGYFVCCSCFNCPTTAVQTHLHQPLPFNKDIELIRYFDSRGFDLLLLPNKTRLWTKDIQLCIMFNTVFSSRTIGLLLSYYLQFFNHITLLSISTRKPHFVPDSVQAIECDSYYGRYQHKCVNTCLSNPASEDVEGFLYIADDMFINITKMGQMDRSKLWFVPIREYNYAELKKMNYIKLRLTWYWFGHSSFDQLTKFIDTLPMEWLELLKKNAGFPDKFQLRAVSDIVYIPMSLSQHMIQILTLMSSQALFNEIATPVAIGLASHPSERDNLTYGYLWGSERYSPLLLESFAETRHFVHPIKLSGYKDRKLWQALMKRQMQHNSY